MSWIVSSHQTICLSFWVTKRAEETPKIWRSKPVTTSKAREGHPSFLFSSSSISTSQMAITPFHMQNINWSSAPRYIILIVTVHYFVKLLLWSRATNENMSYVVHVVVKEFKERAMLRSRNVGVALQGSERSIMSKNFQHSQDSKLQLNHHFRFWLTMSFGTPISFQWMAYKTEIWILHIDLVITDNTGPSQRCIEICVPVGFIHNAELIIICIIRVWLLTLFIPWDVRCSVFFTV